MSQGSSSNFGGLGESELIEGAPRFSVISAPYDRTTTYVTGTSMGPAAIMEASANMELYDEELGLEPWRAGIETLAPLEINDAAPEAMVAEVERASAAVIDAGKVPVLLGGEHSVSLGLARALKAAYPGLSVLQFDAHADLRDSYGGTPFNHACIARRISEFAPLTGVGIRSMSAEEAVFLKSAGASSVRTFYAADVVRDVARSAEAILESLGGDVFVTIDLDVFDPSIMPATGTPEPGGLGWYDVLSILELVARAKNVVGFDVVELAPMAGNVAPDFLAARLVYKLMGYMQR